MLTKTEIDYYNALKTIIGDKYILLPQINLASIINKDSKGYRSELFRNADFGVFDFSYKPLLIIEINDRSHEREDRILRDKKVHKICKKAHLPIITFWTKDGININKMYLELKKYL